MLAMRASSPGRSALLGCFLLAGCAGPARQGARPAVVLETPPPEPAWLAIATAADRDRLARLDLAWEQALTAARTAGFSRRIRREGDLLDPAAALARPSLPPGPYHCRSIRVGRSARGRGSYAVGARRYCFVGADGPLLSLTQQAGAARPGGYLHDDGATRQIFLGALAVRRETVPPAYATDPARDVIGVIERVGDFRYRLVMPWPAGATLEVIELVPALG